MDPPRPSSFVCVRAFLQFSIHWSFIVRVSLWFGDIQIDIMGTCQTAINDDACGSKLRVPLARTHKTAGC